MLNASSSHFGTELPIPNVRFYGESWRVSGLATEIAKATFMTDGVEKGLVIFGEQ